MKLIHVLPRAGLARCSHAAVKPLAKLNVRTTALRFFPKLYRSDVSVSVRVTPEQDPPKGAEVER